MPWGKAAATGLGPGGATQLITPKPAAVGRAGGGTGTAGHGSGARKGLSGEALAAELQHASTGKSEGMGAESSGACLNLLSGDTSTLK